MMSLSHPACWSDEELLSHCKLTFSRASGPGGQNRNKVETAVQIEFLPERISAQASELRTQGENRKVAVLRLRCSLAIELPPIQDPKLIQTWLNHSLNVWNRYCQQGRVNVSESNQEWPMVLATIMMQLRICDWDISATALRLASTTSQLVKTLKKHPPALSRLNAERKKMGQRALN